MILTCPSCATRYFADDAALGQHGRSVRCAACGHSWFAEPQLVLDQTAPEDLLPAAAAAPLTREQVERMRRGMTAPAAAAKIRQQQAERKRQEQIRTAAAAWGGAGVVLALTTTGAIAFREDVAQAWPKTASAYAALGLHVNIWGLEFSDLQIERSYEGPTPVLVVTGSIRNIGGSGKPAPILRFGLRDQNAAELYAWAVEMDGREIPAGGALPFRTVIDNPPAHAADLEATFAHRAEAESLLTKAAAPASEPALELGPPAAVDPAAPADDHGAEPHGQDHSDVPLAGSLSGDGPLVQEANTAAEPIRARPLQDLAPRMDVEPVSRGRG